MRGILAYYYRAFNNFRYKLRNKSPLQVVEIRYAENEFFKYYQEFDLPGIISNIKSKVLITSKKLKRLSLFIDECAVLRVGGRLNKADHMTVNTRLFCVKTTPSLIKMSMKYA